MIDQSAGSDEKSCTDGGLVISLRPEDSHLRVGGGTTIPFERAVLTLQNECGTELVDVVPHATLGQESGTVQDISGVVGGVASLSPGGSAAWDVYDRLIPAHSGSASKVHMFGHRAVLNWKFELTVWADFRRAGAAQPERTPAVRWTLQWRVPDQAAGAVALKVEKKTE